MKRGLAAMLLLPSLASCGSSTTRTVTAPAKTVTRQASATASTSSTSTAPPSATTGAAPPATAGTSTTSTPPAAVYFQGAVGNPRQRPSSLQLTADGTLIVNSVQWTSWGGPVATGTGNAEYHGCNPNCASAPVHEALVSIRLSGIRVCSGRSYYSGVALQLSSRRLLDQGYLQRPWSPC